MPTTDDDNTLLNMLSRAERGDVVAAEWLGVRAAARRDLKLALASARSRGLGSSWQSVQASGRAVRAALSQSVQLESCLERARHHHNVALSGPRPACDLVDAGFELLSLAQELEGAPALEAGTRELLDILLEQASRDLWGLLGACGDHAMVASGSRLLETSRSARALVGERT